MNSFDKFSGRVILIAIVGTVIYAMMYGSLNRGQGDVENAEGNLQSALQRRHDLIPNLVAVVEGNKNHEANVDIAVAEARAKIGSTPIPLKDALADPEKMKALVAQQQDLAGVASRLLVVIERYPDLKAHKGFEDLQSQVEGAENRIKFERDAYNKAVTEQNVRVRGLFMGMVAANHGFGTHKAFEAQIAAQSAPRIEFSK